MYIEPNTTIHILRGVPLDNTYTDTIYFNSPTEQYTHFMSYTKVTLNRNTYQRVNRGRMRVQVSADRIYDYNYLMFQNNAYSGRWFYAFIKSVEYVNDVTCEIEYELDVMQTWFFDVTLRECFVEREHTANDVIGNNITPENFDVGYYVNNINNTYSDNKIESLKAYSLVICSSYNTSSGGVSPIFVYGGIISGVDYYIFNIVLEDGKLDAVELDNAKNLIADLTDKGQIDTITNMFMYPTALIPTIGSTSSEDGKIELNIGNTYSYSKFAGKSLSGYTPKNNKCYTFPYNLIYVGDWNGETSMLLKPEHILSQTKVAITSAFCGTPSALVFPENYNGETYNTFEGYTVSRFPQVAYATDSYRAYIAQGGLVQDTLNALSSEVGFASNIASGNPSGIAQSSLGMVSSIASMVYKTNMPMGAHGKSSSDGLTALRLPFVRVENRCVTPELMKQIDDYFTYYGYAVNELKVPNRNVRPHWTYTKTRGCVLVGEAPADDVRAICNIYDSGITFWKNGNEVGNYSLDNRP